MSNANVTGRNEPKIYVTGATGWVGRSFLHELQNIFTPSQFKERVVAFGSKENIIESTNYNQDNRILIPIKPLSSLTNEEIEGNALVFHSAFLTKDKISKHGTNKFIEINKEITNIVSEFLKKNNNSRVIHISSGAASIAENKSEFHVANTDDPYGFLKLSEEKQLSAVADTQTYRIYGLTGFFIRDPEVFALGDFLMKALKGQPLVVNAKRPIIRSYVNASDLAKCSIKWLLGSEKPDLPIGVSSHITTITALAETIAKQFDLPAPIIHPFKDVANSYSCSPASFYKILKNYKMTPKTLKEQIDETADGLRLRGDDKSNRFV